MQLNYSEQALLGIIYTLCQEKGYSRASNDQLAKEWRRSSRHVRRALERFVGLGLVWRRIKIGNNGKVKRYLKVEEKTMIKSGLVFNTRSTGPDQRDQKVPYIPFPKGKVIPYTAARASAGREGLGSLLGECNGELDVLLQKFFALAGSTGNARYSAQGQFQVVARRWRNRIGCLLTGRGITITKFLSVAGWYLEHVEDRRLPTCLTVDQFCDRYITIEKSKRWTEGDEDREEEEMTEEIEVVVKQHHGKGMRA